MPRTVLLILLLIPALAHAQLVPRENALLNYRIIGFTAPDIQKGTLQIATGHFNNPDSFAQSIIITKPLNHGKTIAEVPAFGTIFTWQIKEDKTHALHHFSTLQCPFGDTATSRLRIVNGADKYPGYYVFSDNTTSLYDMNGNVVWFLPRNSIGNNAAILRDVKLTPQHTVTFIAGDEVREVGYNGNLIWKGPNKGEVSGDTSEAYHHEFTRLANSNYMVLGAEQKKLPLPSYHSANDTLPGNIHKDNEGNYYQSLPFGTVIEYNAAGKVVWAWHSADYFLKSEMFAHYLPDGSLPVIDVHENAFWFDEERKVVYVGFKNISRMLKISHPDGKMLADYGSKNQEGAANHCSNDFCGQHSIRLAKNGDLLVYNNNSASYGQLPYVAAFRETNDTTLAKVWEYTCTWDDISPTDTAAYMGRNRRMAAVFPPMQLMALSMQQSPGGNAIDMPDGEYFISMGGAFGKMLIVNKDKQVQWSAVLEQRIFPDAPWTTPGTYRACIITRADLEEFVWK